MKDTLLRWKITRKIIRNLVSSQFWAKFYRSFFRRGMELDGRDLWKIGTEDYYCREIKVPFRRHFEGLQYFVSLCPFTCRCSAYRSSLPTKASRVTITLALMHGPLILIPLSLANFTALRFHPTLRFASLSYRFVSDTDFTRCSAELSACEKKEKKEKKRNDSSVSFLSTWTVNEFGR